MQYEESQQHMDELMATHWTDIEVYRKSVKDAGFLKEVKRHLGQNSASTVEEKLKTDEE